MVDVFCPFHRYQSHHAGCFRPFPVVALRIGETWSKLKLKRPQNRLFTQLYVGVCASSLSRRKNARWRFIMKRCRYDDVP
ncbi:Hypothetical protein SMB2099_4088 [Serratia marcescens SMB2099]|nr:Hypothetical protein SMB2099_4088 [Serratia marcescens SMB2099]